MASRSATRPSISASTKKYKWAGDGAIAESTNLPALGTRSTASSASTATFRCSTRRSTRKRTRSSSAEAKTRLAKIDPSGPLPDRYVQSNYEAMNALKLGMEKSKFQGRADTNKLIAALEGLEMKEGDDFPQGDKTLRAADHQAFLRQFITESRGRAPGRSSRWSTRTRRSSRRPARSPKCPLRRRWIRLPRPKTAVGWKKAIRSLCFAPRA